MNGDFAWLFPAAGMAFLIGVLGVDWLVVARRRRKLEQRLDLLLERQIASAAYKPPSALRPPSRRAPPVAPLPDVPVDELTDTIANAILAHAVVNAQREHAADAVPTAPPGPEPTLPAPAPVYEPPPSNYRDNACWPSASDTGSSSDSSSGSSGGGSSGGSFD